MKKRLKTPQKLYLNHDNELPNVDVVAKMLPEVQIVAPRIKTEAEKELEELKDPFAMPSFEDYFNAFMESRGIMTPWGFGKTINPLKRQVNAIKYGLPMYDDGVDLNEDSNEIIITPTKKPSKYAISPASFAQPVDYGIKFGEDISRQQMLDDLFISNAPNFEKYQKEVYSRKKGVDWDSDREAYYKWLNKKPLLRSRTRREMLEDRYKDHINTVYGNYANDVASAINYVNGYFKSPQYADRMRGFDIYNPVPGVKEGEKYLHQYPNNDNALWRFNGDDNINQFYIPKYLPRYSEVYPGKDYDPYLTTAHEYAHYMQAITRGLGDAAFNDREKTLFDRRIGNTSNHDSQYAENYADLIATRADMYRKGLVSTPYGEVTPEAIKEYRSKYGWNNRFFDMYTDDDIRSMYNTIAYNGSPYQTNIARADKGKSIKSVKRK